MIDVYGRGPVGGGSIDIPENFDGCYITLMEKLLGRLKAKRKNILTQGSCCLFGGRQAEMGAFWKHGRGKGNGYERNPGLQLPFGWSPG